MANKGKFLYESDGYKYPFLIELPKNEKPFVIEGMPLTAKNIWTYKPREVLVEKILDYIAKNPWIPPKDTTTKEFNDELNKLKNKDITKSLITSKGEIKNASRIGIKCCRDINPEFWFVEGEDDVPSIAKILSDRNILKQILYNRMGSFTSTENHKDGKNYGEQPFVFGINYHAILQGSRSSRKTLTVSNFRPLVAKYIYEQCNSKKVLDISAGWGARAMAALAMNLEYYGIDPLTANNINTKFIDRLHYKNAFVVNGCSEDINSFINIPECDTCISCNPYYTCEIYNKNDPNQSTTGRTYNQWLSEYWDETVKNLTLKTSTWFVFIMVDKYAKYNLAEDMIKIIENHSWKLDHVVPYKTTTSHLSGKRNKGSSAASKNTEKIYFFKKIT